MVCRYWVIGSTEFSLNGVTLDPYIRAMAAKGNETKGLILKGVFDAHLNIYLTTCLNVR